MGRPGALNPAIPTRVSRFTESMPHWRIRAPSPATIPIVRLMRIHRPNASWSGPARPESRARTPWKRVLTKAKGIALDGSDAEYATPRRRQSAARALAPRNGAPRGVDQFRALTRGPCWFARPCRLIVDLSRRLGADRQTGPRPLAGHSAGRSRQLELDHRLIPRPGTGDGRGRNGAEAADCRRAWCDQT